MGKHKYNSMDPHKHHIVQYRNMFIVALRFYIMHWSTCIFTPRFLDIGKKLSRVSLERFSQMQLLICLSILMMLSTKKQNMLLKL